MLQINISIVIFISYFLIIIFFFIIISSEVEPKYIIKNKMLPKLTLQNIDKGKKN